MLYLSESDLRFLVETVATNRRDYDHIINLVRGKEDLLEPMLADPKLAERLLQESETFVRISPYLLFSVLLRRVGTDLEKETYVFEVESKGKRIPVFEAAAVAQLLSNKSTRDYLAELLASFVRTNSAIIYWRERGAWHKKQFSDIDIDDMIDMTRIIDPEIRPSLYRRIADLTLFLSGIFPDHATRFAARLTGMLSSRRTLKDYEQQGKRFYRVAERETDQDQLRPIFALLAEQFILARWALNTLSDRYLKTYRARYFDFPGQQ
jgi:hypothetical protein